ncbi:MAG TPA: NAD(+) diphosphatase [Jatrophihabitantaceae bacterium]|jgi:NAD+ diphosphatase|nr:NAD(+) diphosphatase [Jatrophihabitantaceae bacterium]
MRDDWPLLARAGYDRAAHRRTDEQWLAEAWRTGRVLLLSPKSATPVAADGSMQPALRRSEELPPDIPRRFLGVADATPYFTVTVEPDSDDWKTLRDIGPAVDDLQAGLVTSAVALEQWHQRHTHCPLCGAATRESNAGWTRTCPDDGSDHFPRTDPAVIMLIHDGADHALLGRGQQWGAGRFSTLAGFVEPGESLEAAVAREVYEEVGVHVDHITYIASQPWPFPSSLMLGFSALLHGDAGIHLDPVEMAEAGWFTRAEVGRAAEWVDTGAEPDPSARVQAISPKLSISRFLIDRWLADELP